MEVQIMPALNLGGHWPSSSVGADMIHPWSSLASSAAGAAAEWQQDKGQKSPTWSQDAGTVWNADSPSEKHHRDEKPLERSSSSLRPLSSHNRRKPLSVRAPPSLALPPSPVHSGKTSPGFSNRSDLEDPDTPTEADSGKLAGSPTPRTCINCGTTKTPLWRNGPEGYKSLCNACGIRLKKLSKKGISVSARSPTTATPTTPKPATKKRTTSLYRGSSGDVSDEAATPYAAKRLKAATGPIKKRWVLEEDSSEATSSLHGFTSFGFRGSFPKKGANVGAKVEGYEDEAVGDGDLAVEHGAELLMMLAYGFRR